MLFSLVQLTFMNIDEPDDSFASMWLVSFSWNFDIWEFDRLLVPIWLYNMYINSVFTIHMCSLVPLFQSIILIHVTVSERYYNSIDYFDYFEKTLP